MEVKAATATNNIQTSTWSYKPFIAMYAIENVTVKPWSRRSLLIQEFTDICAFVTLVTSNVTTGDNW